MRHSNLILVWIQRVVLSLNQGSGAQSPNSTSSNKQTISKRRMLFSLIAAQGNKSLIASQTASDKVVTWLLCYVWRLYCYFFTRFGRLARCFSVVKIRSCWYQLQVSVAQGTGEVSILYVQDLGSSMQWMNYFYIHHCCQYVGVTSMFHLENNQPWTIFLYHKRLQ